jgi:hypothetical protein
LQVESGLPSIKTWQLDTTLGAKLLGKQLFLRFNNSRFCNIKNKLSGIVFNKLLDKFKIINKH